MRKYPSRAFTIVELLVVVSIIALLVGILLPAIGKARDQAQLTKSQANIRNLGTAAQTYAAEHHDKQFQLCVDELGKYGTGNDLLGCVTGFHAANGMNHPRPVLGYGHNPGSGGPVIWLYGLPPADGANFAGNVTRLPPINLWGPVGGVGDKFGAFRLLQVRAFNTYVNGRFYEAVYYAPKDAAAWGALDKYGPLDRPGDYTSSAEVGGATLLSTYCYSPAAMFNPSVFGANASNTAWYNNPIGTVAGFRSPTMSQAAYPTLKTQIIEHNWCQNRKKLCNSAWFPQGTYDGCEPYYFNQSWESQPVTLFFDGHIDVKSARDAQLDNQRYRAQIGMPNGAHGLWTIHTPLGGAYPTELSAQNGGYWMTQALDWISTSYHTLTTFGIRGRDFLAR